MIIGTSLFLLNAAVHAGPSLDAANDLYTKGKLPESIKVYKRALREGENPALCYFNCANAYFQLDSLAKALISYRQCIHAAPDYVKARQNSAIIYFMLNDLGGCIAASKQTLQLDPENKKMRMVLAAAYAKSGAIPEAVVQYEYIAKKYPEMTETYVALGEIYRNLNDYETAIRWLNEYPSTGRNFPYVLLLIADMYEKTGDLSRVMFYLQQSFEIDKNRNTFYRMVKTQKQMGNDLVALETALEGMRQFPKFAGLALEAGNIAFERGILEKAEFCYSKAYALGSPGAVVGLENVKIIRTRKALGEQDVQGE